MKTSAEIRQAFLDYFAAHGHQIVESSPLIPANDPTLLFTNAGMVQFKDVFLGQDVRPYTRAVSSQRCVRAGGKHNDLENVGYTARHHTFFEMLGNFSFGDYFKADAIRFAWQFLTEVLQLPTEKLWVTVYQNDDEAADIWLKEIGVDPTRFSRIGDKPGGKQFESDNFWSMGDTGPCGPCSEIFYDHGKHIWGGPPGTPEEDGDRYIEIWNLVFMQFNRSADGEMTALPKPSVDTGMGLERLAAVLQHVHSNYEIDLFQQLITAAAALTKTTDLENKSLRVIADHIRSTAFMIVDGVLPSNEGRGYVLRRIIRRAIRHGYQLGQTQAFFHQLVEALDAAMGEAYPELRKAKQQVAKVLRLEEERFAETLDHGMRVLEAEIDKVSDGVIPGDVVFRLYDTYGFPADLTADIAREQNLHIDMDGFEAEMDKQRQRAREASQFAATTDLATKWAVDSATAFTGYELLDDAGTVLAIYREGAAVASLQAGESAVVILDRTPFYAEAGGQVGDRGMLENAQARFSVQDTRKQSGDVFGHIGLLEQGSLRCGDKVNALVDQAARKATELNHSATHLMHAALRSLLGEHVQQKGSLVNAERLRFDFAHFGPVTHDELVQIERLVNAQIRANAPAETRTMTLDAAKASGAMALFGEKYADEVRVLRLGDFSVELCGGTHVKAAGDIGLFKIVSEAGVASGVRRIEAVTGEHAVALMEAEAAQLNALGDMLKSTSQDIPNKVGQLLQRNRDLEKELDRLKAKLAASAGSDLVSKAVDIAGVKVLAEHLESVEPKALRDMLDQLKNKIGSGVVLLTTSGDGKVNLIAGVTQDLTDRLRAGDLIKLAAEKVGGKGGGRADMAQAGGTDPAGIPAALALAKEWVKQQVA